MGKDTRLVNIYLKIHNKRAITMDDLRYLAEYSPECFEKTCKNVIYNRPETKPVMEPTTALAPGSMWNPPAKVPNGPDKLSPLDKPNLTNAPNQQSNGQENITKILHNLSMLDADAYPVTEIDAGEVRNLLGNLYMELLFPHNDRDSFFDMSQENLSRFDKRA